MAKPLPEESGRRQLRCRLRASLFRKNGERLCDIDWSTSATKSALVRVLPEVVIVTFEPAASLTLSVRPLRLLTTWPGAIFAAVNAPFAS